MHAIALQRRLTSASLARVLGFARSLKELLAQRGQRGPDINAGEDLVLPVLAILLPLAIPGSIGCLGRAIRKEFRGSELDSLQDTLRALGLELAQAPEDERDAAAIAQWGQIEQLWTAADPFGNRRSEMTLERFQQMTVDAAVNALTDDGEASAFSLQMR